VEDQKPKTQRAVWSHVHESIKEQGYQSKTESYAELINHSMDRSAHDFPLCDPEEGCNGLAVILDRKLYSIDLFGREDVYRFYFPRIMNSAFRMVHRKNQKQIDQHEAYYKVIDALDNFEAADRHPETNYTGAGSFHIVDAEELMGFDLTQVGQLIHRAVFAKTV
jgi:hypothetical protein